MKIIAHVPRTLVCCSLLVALWGSTAGAVSYVPQEIIDQGNAESPAHKRQGSTVILFYGVSPEAAHPLFGREFAAFRETGPGCGPEKQQVGKVRIVRLSGNHRLEAVVLEGELREGDIVHLGGSYGLVLATKERCEAPAPGP